MTKRILSPYEQTHLARYGFSHINIDDYGETPVEYVTGKIEFMGQVFDVNKDTLIPRIETEELVAMTAEKAQELAAAKKKITVADVGTGCGAIGITLFLKLNELKIDVELYLSDISEQALEVAKLNVHNKIGDNHKIHIFKSDLLNQFPPEVKLDLIVANLPYIPTDRIAVLDKSVTDFEPHLALDGGEDGLRYVRQLIEQAGEKMNASGTILLEIDYTHDHQFLVQKLNLAEFTLSTQLDESQGTRFAVLKMK